MKILIISDIHANLPALQAVLEAESDAERILCLGDLVDYGPHPVECVEWAMQAAPTCWHIQGNHDRGISTPESTRCSLPYRELTRVTQDFSHELLTPEMFAFLRDLKPMQSLKINGSNVVACHAAPSDPLYLYLRTNDSQRMEQELEIAGHPDIFFFGHTHWPIHQRFGKTLVINPGSVGQPKDGDPSASYAVWDDSGVSLRRAAYDVEKTIRDYSQTPLTASVIAQLSSGLRTGGDLPEPDAI